MLEGQCIQLGIKKNMYEIARIKVMTWWNKPPSLVPRILKVICHTSARGCTIKFSFYAHTHKSKMVTFLLHPEKNKIK
jgi:hypothetical protein